MAEPDWGSILDAAQNGSSPSASPPEPNWGAMLDAAQGVASPEAAMANSPDFGAAIDSAQAPQQSFGLGDTWPARLAQNLYSGAKDAINLPGDWVQAAQSGQDLPNAGDRVMNMAMFGAGVNPAVRAGDFAIPGIATRGTTNAPTVGAIDSAASAGYDAFRKAGIGIDPRAVNQFGSILRQSLESSGFSESNSPQTFATIAKLEKEQPAGAMFSANDFQSARQTFQKTAQNFNAGSDQGAAGKAIGALDGFFNSVPPQGFVAGTPAEVAAARSAFADANANYAGARRAEQLDSREYKIGLQTNATNSGQNLDNKIRQSLTQLLTNPSASSGYSPGELAQMEALVNGSRAMNASRWVGNQLGGGGGLGSLLAKGTGMVAGGLLGHSLGGEGGAIGGAIAGQHIVGQVGGAAKSLENYLAQARLNDLNNTVRMRTPLGQATAPTPLPPSVAEQAPLNLLRAYFMQNPNQT